MTATLAQLLVPQTIEQIFQDLLGFYQANGFPVQSWQPGGTERTRLMAFATGLLDISAQYIPSLASGALLDYAELLENPDWLRLLALNNFEIPYNKANFTIGTIKLTDGGNGPYTFAAGDLIAVFAATGKRYINTNGDTLPHNGTVNVTFHAEFAGASYTDPSNSGSISLATPLPGVTLTNPAGNYTDVAHVGSGTGTLTLGGSPVGAHQVSVRIDSTGAAGVASWSYSLDGKPYVSEGAVTTDANLGGTGISVTLTNGVSGTSFVLDDTYLFNTPGSWITQQGSDDESSPALAERCRDRWSTLSPIPTNSFYELIATSTPTVGSQVTQVKVLTDPVINNKVLLLVAGPEGALPVDTIAAIQSYINPRIPETDLAIVVSPSTLDITIAGNVTVTASQFTAASNAITTAITNYVNASGINGTIRLAKIIDLIMNTSGVIDTDTITINAVAANLTLGSSTSFVIANFLALSLAYTTV